MYFWVFCIKNSLLCTPDSKQINHKNKVFIKQYQDLYLRDTVILSAVFHKINSKIQTKPILK